MVLFFNVKKNDHEFERVSESLREGRSRCSMVPILHVGVLERSGNCAMKMSPPISCNVA